MEQVVKVFIALIRSEICGQPLEKKYIQMLTPEMLEEVYSVASSHDMAHVVAVALKRNKLLGNDKISRKFMKRMHASLMRYELMQHEQTQIYKVLEKERIVFVPLKGSVIRKHYPEQWMRTSCDIDILVRKEDLERAKEVLINTLGYVVGRYKYHDISLYAPSGVQLELHFRITENDKSLDKVLERVWEYVHPIREGRYQHVMTPEYLMFHSCAHMVYHFKYGGCGVRFVVDSWILEKKLEYDDKILKKLCKECRISKFAESVQKLSEAWLEEGGLDDVSKRMQSYIITGGVFGTTESIITARKTKTKGQVKYLFQRVFIPYREFCASYPKLEKNPFLYPYYTVKRWFKIFNRQIAKNAVQEIKINRNILQEDVDGLKQLFRELKL